jgi:hypothetical protein
VSAQLKLFTMGEEAQAPLLPMVATLMQFSPEEKEAAEAAIKVRTRAHTRAHTRARARAHSHARRAHARTRARTHYAHVRP